MRLQIRENLRTSSVDSTFNGSYNEIQSTFLYISFRMHQKLPLVQQQVYIAELE